MSDLRKAAEKLLEYFEAAVEHHDSVSMPSISEVEGVLSNLGLTVARPLTRERAATIVALLGKHYEIGVTVDGSATVPCAMPTSSAIDRLIELLGSTTLD